VELKAGYKPSGVGPIPVAWEERALGEIAVIGSGGTPSRSNPAYWNGSIPWITTAQVDFNEILEAIEYITSAGLKSSAAKLLPPGTLLMALYGQGKTRGKVGVLAIEAATNQACASIAIGKGTSAEFVRYFLSSRYDAIRSASNGGSQDNLSSQIVKSLPVVLPPLAEQKVIAAALSDVDALLGALDGLIAKKRDLKRAAMLQLLTGLTRLPGFRGKWEERRICDMGDVLAGKALNVHGAGRRRPYLRTKNVLDGHIDINDVLEMPMTDAEFERFRVERGDLLLNEGQSLELVGRCSLYRDELPVPCAMQNQLLRFRAWPTTSRRFAEQLFRRCQYNGTFAAIATQTTSVAHLGSNRFANLRLLWPVDSEEQNAIGDVLSDMDVELAALGLRREKTRLLKQGMMQELLTGRTRLA
jgi:type I restriction enzyme, S subunit